MVINAAVSSDFDRNSNYKCPFCFKSYKNLGAWFISHLKKIHSFTDESLAISSNDLIKLAVDQSTKQLVVADTFLKCPTCSRSFKREKCLSNHIKSVHNPKSDRIRNICQHCNARYIRSHKCKKLLPNGPIDENSSVDENSPVFNFSNSYFEEAFDFSDSANTENLNFSNTNFH